MGNPGNTLAKGWNEAVEACARVVKEYKHIIYKDNYLINSCDVVNAQLEIVDDLRKLLKKEGEV